MLKKIKNANGFTIIEALVTLFIFALITVTFYQVFTLGLGFIMEAKNRNAATALANERMEMIRNLNYDDIGTVYGIPDGILDEDEYIVSGGRRFHIKTDVLPIDDDLDGIGGSDTVNTVQDYKTAKITILWGKEEASNQVELVSRFVPQGREENRVGEGTLVINVTSNTDPISEVSVNIQNTDVSPNVNKNTETNDIGQVSLPGAKISTETYKIKVLKSGYETVETMDPNDPALPVGFVPLDIHGSVYANGIPGISTIKINKLVQSLKISSVSGLGEAIPNVKFSIVGGRQMNVPGETGEKIFNCDKDETTKTSGEINLSDDFDLSPGEYFWTPSEEVSEYTFIKSEPPAPYTIDPGESLDAKMIFANVNRNSLWVKIVKEDTSPVPAGAIVKLKNATEFENTQTTLADGIAFFSNADNAIVAGDYELEISAAGFENKTVPVTIDNKLTKIEDVVLTAQ